MLVTNVLLSFPFKCLFSSAASIAVSAVGLRKNSLSFSGALAAVMVGFTLTMASYCFFSCLLTFFISSSFWTKWKSDKKRKVEGDFKEGGQRNWFQVVSNSGLPFLVSIIYLFEVGFKERPIDFARDFIQSALGMTVFGAIACCNGDTWSSEIGTAVGSRTPRLITTWKKVPVGTNGAVSIVGIAASILGGLIIGIIYYVTIESLNYFGSFSHKYPPQWPIILLGCFSGFFGSMIDSILGATLQYSGFCEAQRKVVHQPSASSKHICGRNILSNNLVNLISSSLTGMLTSYTGYVVWKYVEDSYF